MPFQTSRHTLAFAMLSSCICGAALIAQTPKVLLALSGPFPTEPKASPRTAHTLQPPPPSHPLWEVDSVPPEMDYPDVGIAAGGVASFEPMESAAIAGTVAGTPVPSTPLDQSFGFDDFAPDPVQSPVAPNEFKAGSFEADDIQAFEMPPAGVSSEPTLPPPATVAAVDAFSSAPVPTDVFESADDLGPGQSEPWPSEPVDIVNVPQLPPAAPNPVEPAPRIPVELVREIAVLTFSEPAAEDREQQVKKPKAVQGSYRIRRLYEQEKVPQRLRQTYRFSAPPIEAAPKPQRQPASAVRSVRPPARAQHRTACPHCRNQQPGSRVCPGCGTIHPQTVKTAR